MEEKKTWGREETFHLISLYEQHPELWDVKSKNYKDKVLKNSTLQELASEFDTTGPEVSRKLHNLKTQFGQEVKKHLKRKCGQGAQDSPTSKWEYFESLKFTFSPQSTPEESMNCTTQSIKFEAVEIPEEVESESSVVSKRIKYTPIKEDNYNKPMKSLEKPYDEFQVFGDYVASELRNMHYLQNIGHLKRIIQRSIIEWTEKDESEFFVHQDEED